MRISILLLLATGSAFAGTPPNKITISNSTGATVNQPFLIPRFFAKGEIAHYPSPSGIAQWQSEVKTRWPDGSVQFSLIAFWQSIPDASSVQISFVDSTNACYLGDSATCIAAGLDASGMTGFNGGNWGAAIQATQNSTTYTIDAKTLITAGAISSYWAKGPIVTIPVVEDRTSARTYDFGWTCNAKYQLKYTGDPLNLTVYDYATGTTPTNPGWLEGQQVAIGTTVTPGPTGLMANNVKYVGGKIIRSPSGSTLQVANTVAINAVWNTTPIHVVSYGNHNLTTGDTILIAGNGVADGGPYTVTVIDNDEFTLNGTTARGSTAKIGSIVKPSSTISSAGAGVTYISTCGVGDYSGVGTTWANDSTYRSIHPQFILTFFPGWAGVYEEYVGQNGWTTAMQDQRYALSILQGLGNAVTARSLTFTQYAHTEWVWRDWDGTPTQGQFFTSDDIFVQNPATVGVKIDLNMPYIVYSKMVPQFNPTLTVNPDYAGGAFVTADTTYVGTLGSTTLPFVCTQTDDKCGGWYKTFAAPGGRPDIGWAPRGYMRWLYTWDPRIIKTQMGNADAAGTAPYHTWEGATGKWYDSGRAVDAFGHPVSVDARPTLRITRIKGDDAVNAGDHMTFIDPFPSTVGTGLSLSPGFLWDPEYTQSDPEHQPAFHYLPYMLTGDYFYLQDALGYVSQYPFAPDQQVRHQDWALPWSAHPRGIGWALRSEYMVSVMAPDDWPEKAYFHEKANNAIPYIEALAGITNGRFSEACDPNTFNQATSTSKYCWSALTREAWSPTANPWHLVTMRACNYVCNSTIAGGGATWGGAIITGTAGHMAELGWPSDILARETAKFQVEATNSSTNPHAVDQYFIGSVLTNSANAPTIQTSMTNTSVTPVTLSAPLTGVDVPFTAQLGSEWIYWCDISADRLTITPCTNGRAGGMHNNPSYVNNAKASHAIGTALSWGASYKPYVHAVSEVVRGLTSAGRPSTLPMSGFYDKEFGYGHLASWALVYADDTYSTGQNGFDAWKTLMALRDDPTKNSDSGTYPNLHPFTYTGEYSGYDPRLQFLPRRDPPKNISIKPGDTFAIINYTAPSAGRSDSACTIDGVDDGQSGKKFRSYVKSGLTASTAYTSSIHCSADYYDSGTGVGNTSVNYTTVPSITSGVRNVSIRLGPGAATAYLDFGSTTSLGSTVSTSCTSGCTLTAALPCGTAYFRTRRSDGSTGSITPAVVSGTCTAGGANFMQWNGTNMTWNGVQMTWN